MVIQSSQQVQDQAVPKPPPTKRLPKKLLRQKPLTPLLLIKLPLTLQPIMILMDILNTRTSVLMSLVEILLILNGPLEMKALLNVKKNVHLKLHAMLLNGMLVEEMEQNAI